MDNQQNFSDLDESTYLTCDAATHARFEEWIGGMTMERDGEFGADRQQDDETIPGFLSWIREHNVTFQPGGLFQTFIWRDRNSGEIVATGTIAADDRGVKEQYKLGGDDLWGGVNVRFDRRYQGIGKNVCARIDQHIQRCADSEGKEKLFHLFTANPSAEAIYEKLGFKRNPLGEINTAAFGDERLWSKTYSPTTSGAQTAPRSTVRISGSYTFVGHTDLDIEQMKSDLEAQGMTVNVTRRGPVASFFLGARVVIEFSRTDQR